MLKCGKNDRRPDESKQTRSRRATNFLAVRQSRPSETIVEIGENTAKNTLRRRDDDAVKKKTKEKCRSCKNGRWRFHATALNHGSRCRYGTTRFYEATGFDQLSGKGRPSSSSSRALWGAKKSRITCTSSGVTCVHRDEGQPGRGSLEGRGGKRTEQPRYVSGLRVRRVEQNGAPQLRSRLERWEAWRGSKHQVREVQQQPGIDSNRGPTRHNIRGAAHEGVNKVQSIRIL